MLGNSVRVNKCPNMTNKEETKEQNLYRNKNDKKIRTKSKPNQRLYKQSNCYSFGYIFAFSIFFFFFFTIFSSFL